MLRKLLAAVLIVTSLSLVSAPTAYADSCPGCDPTRAVDNSPRAYAWALEL